LPPVVSAAGHLRQKNMPELTPTQLRRKFIPANVPYASTLEIEPCTTIIGQDRGVAAIEFGMEMQSRGYNIYVLGESGTGRTSAIQSFVTERAAGEPVPNDWVYVNNFQSAHEPIAIELPAGEGCRLRDMVEMVIGRIRSELPSAFDTQQFRDEVLLMRQAMQAESEGLFGAFQKHAVTQGATLMQTSEGFRIVPAQDGQPLEAEAIAALDDEQKEAWRGVQNGLEKGLTAVIFKARDIENSAQERMGQLVERVAASIIDVALKSLQDGFADYSDLVTYIGNMRDDILKHVNNFRPQPEGTQQRLHPDWFRRYKINVIIDHKLSTHAPVIAELEPSVPRVLGRVEHEARPGGAVVTDFTLLRAGALHAANGGYLVLRARDLGNSPGAYEALKRALIGNQVRPDDPAIRGGAATLTLDPQPIPLNIKVILIGPPSLYYQLAGMDEDFATIFKVMADFDHSIERDAENEMAYATFISARCVEEGLMPFDRAAIGKIIEFGSRMAGTQKKLSTRFGVIADLIREANHWAKKAKGEIISAENVLRAINNRYFLRNRIETRMREGVEDRKQLITTSGYKVGQINGLAVSQIGDHSFGHPSRLTTRTYVGKRGVVAIDREVNMAGAIHNKGLMTLTGYIGGQYAHDHPLSLSAQITFEQNYGGIDGDSASSTELYALLSSLSETPIRQSIAVTGSVNQYGEVQAIGGATQKIEGWYDVCKTEGLTGKQGAMIPASNVVDLMLRDEIVKAVEEGEFHVWSVDSIDEGLEILTGVEAPEIHDKVKAKLRKLADTLAAYEGS
ncbi:MAG: Lon protease family protein, partial [Candidatus Promineifilaceae bacterium]